MNQILQRNESSLQSPSTFYRPTADVSEQADKYVIHCDLPGISPASLEITLADHLLEITGRAPQQGETSGRSLYREFAMRDYRRTFRLGREIDENAITADLRHGLLEVTLPKRQVPPPRKIEVIS